MGEFMEKNSLIGLVERAADGDARAIEALYNATYSGAYSLAGHLCSNRNDVEDILQESYITAFSRLRSIRDKAAFPAWLRKIVINTWRSYAKDKANIYETTVDSQNDDYFDEHFYTESALDTVEISETSREIFELVNQLPENQRVCMILFYYEDMRIEEIAEALNIPAGSVKSRLYYGRQQLRRMMELRGFDSFGTSKLPAAAVTADSAMLARILAAITAASGKTAAGGGIALKIGAAVASLIAVGGIIGGAAVISDTRREQPMQTAVTKSASSTTAVTTITTATTETAATTATEEQTEPATTTTAAVPTQPRIFTTFDYREEGDGIIITRYTGNESNVIIPESLDGMRVTAIGEGAFKGGRVLRSVVIPESVRRIGSSAFKDCRNLASVTFGDGVEEIGGSAFLGCTALTGVVIPANVRSIGALAFADCMGLEKLEAAHGVEIIGYSAFRDCKSLKNAVLPESVVSIGGDSFDGASESFYISAPDDSYAYRYAAEKGFLPDSS